MWEALYMEQQHQLTTEQTHFAKALPVKGADGALPKGLDEDRMGKVWRQLDYEDYEDMAERPGTLFNLPEYRQEDNLTLTLKVLSVAPRVFEIDNFLSQFEVDHILQMARLYNNNNKGQGYPARHDCSPIPIGNRYQPNRFATLLFFLGDGAEYEGDEYGISKGD